MKMCFLLPAVGMLAGCAPPAGVPVFSSPSPLRDAAVGCWRLESSRGLFGRALPRTVVRLDTVPSRSGGMRMLLIPDPNPHMRDLNTWGTTADGDVLLLLFSGGFSGVDVRASLHGDRLRGRARTWEDVPSLSRRGAVRGVRVPCPPGSAPS